MQQGQVFELTTRVRDGGRLWAYRFRVGGRGSRSDTFRTLWAAHNVRVHDTGVKRIQHPLVGDLELTYETMALTANPGLTIAVFTAEPGSKSEQALNLLASWTPTHEQPESAFTRPHG
jgi:hypothetical protein